MLQIITALLLCLMIVSSSAVAVSSDTPNITTTTLNDPTKPIPEANYLANEEDYNYNNPFGIRISGIIFAKDRKLATINEHILQIGAKIGDFTLTDIYPDAVRVKNTSGEFIIKAPYRDIKQSIPISK